MWVLRQCRRALKDKGVTFHPDVALQAMEEVKRRRQERVAAAAEVHIGSTDRVHSGSLRV